jgi:hypothetical protein
MEIPKKREAGILKSAATAGLVFLAGGQVEAQDFSHWRVVGEQEFKRLHIPDSLVQKVSAKEGLVPIDETKAARAYSDARTTYYWINKDTPKTKAEDLASTPQEDTKAISENELAELKAKTKKNAISEKEKTENKILTDVPGTENKTTAESIPDRTEDLGVGSLAEALTDSTPNIEERSLEETPEPEIVDTPPVEEKDPAELEMDTIMEKLEEYVNRFEVKEAYVTNSSGKEYSLAEIPVEAFEDPEDKTDLSGALIIHDIETDTEYEVRRRNKHGLTDGVFYFAEALKNSNARGACLELLTKQGKTELSPEEKIKYLQEFFTSGIEGLKKYNQPKVSDDLAFKN